MTVSPRALVSGPRPEAGGSGHVSPTADRMAGLTVGVVASLIWLGRRAWRRGAWLEALPVLVGMPWLGRAIWAGRAVWMGRAAWRASARFRPAYPAGHDRTAARSGTTR